MKQIIDKYSRLDFTYGAADCCTFVAECIEAVTGKNPLAEFVYSGRMQAYRFIAKCGSLEATISHFLGEPEFRGYTPKDGDCALTDSLAGDMAGVVYRGRLLVRTENGVTDWPLTRARRFWKV